MVSKPPSQKDNKGHKSKPDKPSVQTPEEENAMEEVEDQAYHGGRSKWPNGDVNDAPDIHIDNDEKGSPAVTHKHSAQQRSKKKVSKKTSD